jgi:acyl carrier protein
VHSAAGLRPALGAGTGQRPACLARLHVAEGADRVCAGGRGRLVRRADRHAVPRTKVGSWPSAGAVAKAYVLDPRHVVDPSGMYHDRAIRDPLDREWLCRDWSRVLRGLRSGRCEPERGMKIWIRRSIRAEVTEFIVTNYLFGEVSRAPRDEDSLVDEGIIDSTGVLELTEFLGSHFAIEVSEAEALPQNLGSISDFTEFVMSKGRPPGAGGRGRRGGFPE